MKIHQLILFCAALLIGCDQAKPGNWIATRDIQVFEAVNGKQTFVIHKGEICQKGGESIGKVDKYTQVFCADKKGWVIDDEYLALQK
jgi:hypothetical protein